MVDIDRRVTCAFIVRGKEVHREQMEHPGMESFVKEWTEELPYLIPPTLRRGPDPVNSGESHSPDSKPEEKKTIARKSRFYYGSMDSKGVHFFYECQGFQGEVL